MSRRPAKRLRPTTDVQIDDDRVITSQERRRRAAAHARAVRNLKGDRLQRYYREREAERERQIEKAAEATEQLVNLNRIFQEEQLHAKRAAQARRRRAKKRIQAENARAEDKAEAVRKLEEKLARNPERAAQIERYRKRRRRILNSVVEINLEDDEDQYSSSSDEEEDDEYNWLVDDDEEMSEEAARELDVIRGSFRAALFSGSVALKQAARKLPPPPAIPEDLFKTSAGDFAKSMTQEELDEMDEEAAIQQDEEMEQETVATPTPRRVQLTTVSASEVELDPKFYIPEPAPSRRAIGMNTLRYLTPEEIMELKVDIEIEQEERREGKHNEESAWDILELKDDKLSVISQHCEAMEKLHVFSLISMQANPKPLGIGAMFKRLFLG